MTEELATWLSANSLVQTGYTVYRDFLPATPDKVIMLRQFGGAGVSESFDGTTEMPILQVITRGSAQDVSTPRLAIERIYQAFCQGGIGAQAFVASGVRYQKVMPQQAPFPVNRDQNERCVYSVNFLVEKDLSPLT